MPRNRFWPVIFGFLLALSAHAADLPDWAVRLPADAPDSPPPAAVVAEAQANFTLCEAVAPSRLDDCRALQAEFARDYAYAYAAEREAEQGIASVFVTGRVDGIQIIRPNRLQACAWMLASTARHLDQAEPDDGRRIRNICGGLDRAAYALAQARAGQLVAVMSEAPLRGCPSPSETPNSAAAGLPKSAVNPDKPPPASPDALRAPP